MQAEPLAGLQRLAHGEAQFPLAEEQAQVDVGTEHQPVRAGDLDILEAAMALMHARVKRIVFGAHDPKTGVAGSVFDLFELRQLNHHTQVAGGLLADASGRLLKEFFAQRREQIRQLRDARRVTMPPDRSPEESQALPDEPQVIPVGHVIDEAPGVREPGPQDE